MNEFENLAEQTKIAIEFKEKHKQFIEENPPLPGPWKKCIFICPDCATQITIRTRLPFEKPFRMACPCQYSGMHRATEWELDREEQ